MRHKLFWIFGLLCGGLALGVLLALAGEPARPRRVGPSDTERAPDRLVQRFNLSVAYPDGPLIGNEPSPLSGGHATLTISQGTINEFVGTDKGTVTLTPASGSAEPPTGRGAEPARRTDGPATVVSSQGTINEFPDKDKGVVTLTPAGASADPPALSITVIVEARPSPPRGPRDCPNAIGRWPVPDGPSEYVYPMQVHWRPGATAADPGTIDLTTHDPRPVGPQSGCPLALYPPYVQSLAKLQLRGEGPQSGCPLAFYSTPSPTRCPTPCPLLRVPPVRTTHGEPLPAPVPTPRGR